VERLSLCQKLLPLELQLKKTRITPVKSALSLMAHEGKFKSISEGLLTLHTISICFSDPIIRMECLHLFHKH